MKTLVALVLLALLPATAMAAAAEPGVEVRVSHADLNLASPEGRRALESRIRSAVRSVCGVPSGGMSTAFNQAIEKCSAAATAAALRSIPVEPPSAG